MSDVRIRDEIAKVVIREIGDLLPEPNLSDQAFELADIILSIPAIKEALSLKMQMDAAIEEFEARGGVAQDYKPN